MIPVSNHTIRVAGLIRELPLLEVAPNTQIAILNILGDTELVHAASRELSDLLLYSHPEVIVVPAVKSILLGYAISVQTGLPYVVLTKTYKPYMGNSLSAEVISITTGRPQTLYLSEPDRSMIKGKRVALVDDVISTGSTLKAMEEIMTKAHANVVVRGAVFTEGDEHVWRDNVVALGHLPIFRK